MTLGAQVVFLLAKGKSPYIHKERNKRETRKIQQTTIKKNLSHFSLTSGRQEEENAGTRKLKSHQSLLQLLTDRC